MLIDSDSECSVISILLLLIIRRYGVYVTDRCRRADSDFMQIDALAARYMCYQCTVLRSKFVNSDVAISAITTGPILATGTPRTPGPTPRSRPPGINPTAGAPVCRALRLRDLSLGSAGRDPESGLRVHSVTSQEKNRGTTWGGGSPNGTSNLT